MRFKIKEIGDEGVSLDLPITAAWLKAECPDLDATPGPRGLRLQGQLLLSGEDVFLRGTLRGAFQTTCSRCLEPARLPVDVPLAVTFVSRSDDDEGEDDEDEEADVDVATFDGDEVDLGPELRDQILLAFPMARFCRDNCAGLCPVCGGNRNQVACDCQSRTQAPRGTSLAVALGKLKI